MKSDERDSWIAQLEAERAERAKDRVAYLEALDKMANEHIAERTAWTAHLMAEREARAAESAELSGTVAALLERSQDERSKLLDRIEGKHEYEPKTVGTKLPQPTFDPEPVNTPEDLENYAHVGGIVPEGVKVGMDTPWPPPTYPQTPFANSEE